jgi:hypothetical protein
MPINGSHCVFSRTVVSTVYEVGAVYGLFRYSPETRIFYCLYVGETDNLRRRLSEHLNNPPAAGITHFFAETYGSATQRREREAALIAEFQPVGNAQLRR